MREPQNRSSKLLISLPYYCGRASFANVALRVSFVWMKFAVLGLLLAGIFGLLSRLVQDKLRTLLFHNPVCLLAAPVILTAYFSVAASLAGAFSFHLAALVLAYTGVPALVAFAQPRERVKCPSAMDFATMLLLWLPLEAAVGASLVPRPAQGFLHSAAYGTAILLGLAIFLGYRSLDGMKYCWPSTRDVRYAALGFVLTAPVLIAVGRAIDFIPPYHAPAGPWHRWPVAFLVILVGTGLPEEILFRCLVQNGLMLRFGSGFRTLFAAGLIFGCAHLDNGPQPAPNWRYMILATLAGCAYGKVFQKGSSVWSSALFHALVDVTKHAIF